MMLRMHKIEDKWYIDLKFKLNHNYNIRRRIKQLNVDILSLEFSDKFDFKYSVYVNKMKRKLYVDIITDDITVCIGGKINNLYNDFFEYLRKCPNNIIHLNNL